MHDHFRLFLELQKAGRDDRIILRKAIGDLNTIFFTDAGFYVNRFNLAIADSQHFFALDIGDQGFRRQDQGTRNSLENYPDPCKGAGQ